jgi:hypothetical protein
VDNENNAAAMQNYKTFGMGNNITYTTNWSFEKVSTFYKQKYGLFQAYGPKGKYPT